MAINFPSSPIQDEIFTQGTTSWKWNGFAWEIFANASPSFTSVTASSVNASAVNADAVATTSLSVTGTVTGLSLSNLSDINLTTAPTNGQTLVYNSTTSKFAPGTISGGSGSFNGGTITNPLVINNATATIGVSSGALRVTGGVAVGDDLYVAGTVTVEDESLDLKASAELKFYNTSNSNYVGFSAPDALSTNKIYILPTVDGSNGQFLKTNGSGILSWASASSASGGTPPGGNDTYVQFNDNNEFAGVETFTFDQITGLLTVPKLTATGIVNLSETISSTNSTSGALTVAGGVGISGQLNVAGTTNKFTSGTASTSTITGAIVVTGGMGVSGRINVGSTVSADTAPSAAEHLTNKRYVDANVLAFSVAFGA